MKNLKTVGKVVALTALVATQANAWKVPGWDWTKKHIMNPVTQKGSDALKYAQNIQWKDQIKPVIKEFDIEDGTEYLQKGTKQVKEVIPGVWSKLAKPFIVSWRACSKENAKKVYNTVFNKETWKNIGNSAFEKSGKLVNGAKDIAKKAKNIAVENPKTSIAIGIGATAFGAVAVVYAIVKKLNKKTNEKKSN